MALYACLELDQIAVTIESKNSYINPALPGRIFGSGRIEHLKGEICFTSGQLSNEAGKVLATATATYRISKMNFADAKGVDPAAMSN
ncbi:PaaI family thioesterase [Pseudomonas fluorescens]|uniref:PaaI family thioesterase n=1 Tax=Pseudomonas fluorescens TaxID=294 RepID=UPI0009359B7A|nr:PaaI family thioesterase [Pseudomonas fluorescens]